MRLTFFTVNSSISSSARANVFAIHVSTTASVLTRIGGAFIYVCGETYYRSKQHLIFLLYDVDHVYNIQYVRNAKRNVHWCVCMAYKFLLQRVNVHVCSTKQE